jgi:hypothetical protein
VLGTEQLDRLMGRCKRVVKHTHDDQPTPRVRWRARSADLSQLLGEALALRTETSTTNAGLRHTAPLDTGASRVTLEREYGIEERTGTSGHGRSP